MSEKGDTSRVVHPVPMTLGSLAALALDERAALVERHGHDQLNRACDALARAGSRCAGAVTARRIAWAMAYNLADSVGAESAAANVNPRFLGVRSRSDADRWSADTPWHVVWAHYCEPHRVIVFPTDAAHPEDRTLLRELARSVASEQRRGYPWSPEAIDDAAAQACQHEAYELSRARISGLLGQRRQWAVGRDEVIGDTWLRAVRTAWGPDATQRFIGRSLISSWLCAIAINAARHRARVDARLRRRERSLAAGDAEQLAADGAESLEDTTASDVELARRFRECLESLDAPSRELIRQFLEGQTPGDIARARGTTPPTVSQHQERLIRNLRRCFSERAVRPGASRQKVFKTVRELLASLGPDLFPFLRKPPHRTGEP